MTDRSPAELLLGRQPRSRLDLLHPDESGKVQGIKSDRSGLMIVTLEREHSRLETKCMFGIFCVTSLISLYTYIWMYELFCFTLGSFSVLATAS